MTGAHALVAGRLLRPDYQLLALEPTGLRLRIAQISLRWLESKVFGKMAHAGHAPFGVDANHVVVRIVDRLKARVEALSYHDPLLGQALFTCGRIEGGITINVVSPPYTVRLDLRLVPPLDPEHMVEFARAVVEESIGEFSGESYKLRPLGVARPPMWGPRTRPWWRASAPPTRRSRAAHSSRLARTGMRPTRMRLWSPRSTAARAASCSARNRQIGRTWWTSVEVEDPEVVSRLLEALVKAW